MAVSKVNDGDKRNGLQIAAIVLPTSFLALALISVGLRITSSRIRGRSMGVADLFILAAVVSVYSHVAGLSRATN